MWWRASVVIISALVLFQACAKKGGPQDSCNFVMNSDQQRVSWHAKLPVTLYVHSSVPPSYYSAITNAMDTWNKALNINAFNPPAYTNTPDNHASDGYNVIYWITKDWFGTSDEQARTSLFYVDDQIYEADIRVNASNFNFSTDAPQADQVDFQSLMLHELGHVLGLAHIPTTDSVMFKSLASDKERRDPFKIDLTSLSCEY